MFFFFLHFFVNSFFFFLFFFFIQRANTSLLFFNFFQVHLRNGVFITKKRMDLSLKMGKTDSKFIAWIARSLWEPEELLDRSVKGLPCRRLVKDGATAKKELTPIKVNAMEGGWL